MTITGTGNTGGGLAFTASPAKTYFRVEARARSQAGSGWGQALLLWPDSDELADGEIDFCEIVDPARQWNQLTLHNGPSNRMSSTRQTGNFTDWHDYAVEWTPEHVNFYIDGLLVNQVQDPTMIPRTPMHLAVQEDAGPLGTWIPPKDTATPNRVTFSVDWVRFYSL